MSEKLEETWSSREFPVLIELARRSDELEGLIESKDVAESLGWEEITVRRAMNALNLRGFLVGAEGTAEMMGPQWCMGVTGSAYMLTGLHPDGDDALSRLIDGLRQAADQTADEHERGRLRQAADVLGGLTRDIAVGVLTSVITRSV